MTLSNRVVVVCLAVGCVLIVAGLIIGMPPVSFDGAYFDRANGAPAFAGVYSASAPVLFDPSDGNLWLGAGLVLVVAAAIAGICTRRAARRKRPLSD